MGLYAPARSAPVGGSPVSAQLLVDLVSVRVEAAGEVVVPRAGADLAAAVRSTQVERERLAGPPGVGGPGGGDLQRIVERLPPGREAHAVGPWTAPLQDRARVDRQGELQSPVGHDGAILEHVPGPVHGPEEPPDRDTRGCDLHERAGHAPDQEDGVQDGQGNDDRGQAESRPGQQADVVLRAATTG
jgi:hypothetical protein